MTTAIKGASVGARIDFVKQRFGEDTWQKVLSHLSEDDQKTLTGNIIVLSFYPLALNARLDEAIAKATDPNNPIRVYRALGRASAEANLTSVHKTFILGDSPHRVLKRYPSVRKIYYSDGTGHYEKVGEKEGFLELKDADFTLEDDESTAGYFERGIELMGGKNVKVEVTRKPRSCEYRFSWE
ncbi:MAG: DUF2378 family protein [Cytophagales bacterium]|nr:DUF2378 family protein [Cytophagales bacterium]